MTKEKSSFFYLIYTFSKTHTLYKARCARRASSPLGECRGEALHGFLKKFENPLDSLNPFKPQFKDYSCSPSPYNPNAFVPLFYNPAETL
jgi:hypothetical protein